MARDLLQLPDDLPVPQDDGACDHLPGLPLPAIALPSTSGRRVELRRVTSLWIVIYCYPRTGVPGQPLFEGWDQIPGARGCTPQSCGFRDLHRELAEAGATVFGLSTQDTEYQRELHGRLHLPFDLLSDAEFLFTRALRLPTFPIAGLELVKRLTLIARGGGVARGGVIEKVFYPVFPPDENAANVLAYLRAM